MLVIFLHKVYKLENYLSAGFTCKALFLFVLVLIAFWDVHWHEKKINGIPGVCLLLDEHVTGLLQIELRRAYNCEIMLSKVKIPLPDLMVR